METLELQVQDQELTQTEADEIPGQYENGYYCLRGIKVRLHGGLNARSAPFFSTEFGVKGSNDIAIANASRPNLPAAYIGDLTEILTLGVSNGNLVDVFIEARNGSELELAKRIHKGLTTNSEYPNFR